MHNEIKKSNLGRIPNQIKVVKRLSSFVLTITLIHGCATIP